MEILSSRLLLRPTDPLRTRNFYKNIIGLHVYREFGEPDVPGTVFFLGGGFLEVSGRAQHTPGSEPGALRLWLQIPDAHAAHSHLRSHGVPLGGSPKTMPWGLIEFSAWDPDGRELVFVEVPSDHPLRRDLRP